MLRNFFEVFLLAFKNAMGKKNMGHTILTWLLAVIFAFVGVVKLSGQPAMAGIFANFGLPLWFMYFIGASELAGALGLVFGAKVHAKLPGLAACGLIIIMLGAAAMHIIHDPITMAIPTVVLFVLLILAKYGMKDKGETHAATPPPAEGTELK